MEEGGGVEMVAGGGELYHFLTRPAGLGVRAQVGELERLLKRPLPTAVADQTTFLEDLKRSEARLPRPRA